MLVEQRYDYIDNLRSLMIILVVVLHLAVTYSGMGGWFYKENSSEDIDIICTVFFGTYQSVTQGYFMGLLFLISGYFVSGSYNKKGPGKFLKERFVRLGIPTLIFMFFISPFINYVMLQKQNFPNGITFADFVRNHFLSFGFLEASGPMWFAFALLIFNVFYVLYRMMVKESDKKTVSIPGTGYQVLLMIVIALFAFLIRIFMPIGTSVINMQLCYFSQYIILFIVGIYAGQNRWFEQITYKSGKRWLILALTAGVAALGIIMLAGGALEGKELHCGGLTWQSAAFALWESFTAVSMSIGLVGVFKEKQNIKTSFTEFLNENSFSVYLFHPPIIIAVTLLLRPIEWYPLFKFVFACVISIPICFLSSKYVFRKIPLLKKVL